MKKNLIISIILIIISCLTTLGCRKVSRKDSGISRHSIHFSSAAGSEIIESNGIHLDCLAFLQDDGKYEEVYNCGKKTTPDNELPEGCSNGDLLTYLQHDWIEVKNFYEGEGKMQTRITVQNNESGKERICIISVHSGDTGDGIKVYQEK